MKIIKKLNWATGNTEVVFRSKNSVEINTVYKALKDYHHYDNVIYIHIEDDIDPELKSFKDFYEVYEYRYYIEERIKKYGIEKDILYPVPHGYHPDPDSINWIEYISLEEHGIEGFKEKIEEGFKRLNKLNN